jgi:hypothetical protein
MPPKGTRIPKEVKIKISKTLKGRKLTKLHKINIGNAQRGVFKKITHLSIKQVHNRLRDIYGKANKCENPYCPRISKIFDWSLIKEKRYVFKRENFQMLCRQCHINYDFTEERRRSLKGNTNASGKRTKIQCKRIKLATMKAKKLKRMINLRYNKELNGKDLNG